MSQKEKSLLGKKHKKEKEEEEENSSNKNNEENEESKSGKSNSSSSEDDDKPVKSIFNNPEKETGFKTEGLFGTNSENKGSLFGKSPNLENGGAFGDLSNPIKTPVSLFGSSSDNLIKKDSSLFGSGLFTFNTSNSKDEKKDSKSDEEEGDDNIGQSNSPNAYNPEKETEKEKENNNNGFKKIYIKRVDDLYTLNKEEKKYISKGNGYISIEIKKDNDDKRFAVLMFRNLIGKTLLEGIFNEKIDKLDTYEKKFKYVAHLMVVIKENDEKDKNKISICNVKIPFMKNEELKLFEDKYKETIKFINKEIDDIKKD